MKKLIGLLLLSLSLPAMAQQYDIEVILFTRSAETPQLEPSQADSEIDLSHAGSLSDDAFLAQTGTMRLPRSSFQLNSQEQALRTDSALHVLLHTAWRQEVQAHTTSPIFHIQAGKTYYDQGTPVHQLDGRLQVYNNQYLYAETIFDLTEPNTKATLAPLRHARLDQKRRMNAQEIHYFDHEHMGMIIQARPVQE